MSDLSDAQLFTLLALACLTIFGFVYFGANALFERADRRIDDRDVLQKRLRRIASR